MQKNQIDPSSFNQEISEHLILKREDLLGNGISGNKLRKLKFNILEAQKLGVTKIITFGGGYSNHILAASYIKKIYDIDIIGVIRGEELMGKIDDNPTLKKAQENGMQFHFVSREQYREKMSLSFIESLKMLYGDFYLLPEGGTNDLAIKGCEEILTEEDSQYNYICCAVGTGGTLAGLINASQSHQQVLGFSALKGDFLKDDVSKLVTKDNWSIQTDYHFGGYAKVTKELIDFMNVFKTETNILLDPIYNAKMLFGVYDLIKSGYFSKNTSILAIHTGGVQAISGMNKLLAKKGLPLINI
ncbi:MAG: 1-aminocyclopropane-1-carboxylate deaminase/D-cysteine desulfhydrase [Flavobacteriaceae bacterium]